MGRMATGGRMLRETWSVLREAPSLLAVVAAGVIGHAAVAVAAMALLLGGWPQAEDLLWPRYLLLLVAIGLGSYVSQFANAAAVATTHARLAGRPATAGDGLRVAAARLPRIFAWTTLSLTVGLVLTVVAERVRLGGVIMRWALGLAWGLATFFAVPVLVVEDVTVRQAVRRSARLFRATWGESVTAGLGQGAISFACFLVVLAVGVPTTVVLAHVSLGLAVGFAAVALTAHISLVAAYNDVLRTALYAYAAEGRAAGAFRPKRGRAGRRLN